MRRPSNKSFQKPKLHSSSNIKCQTSKKHYPNFHVATCFKEIRYGAFPRQVFHILGISYVRRSKADTQNDKHPTGKNGTVISSSTINVNEGKQMQDYWY